MNSPCLTETWYRCGTSNSCACFSGNPNFFMVFHILLYVYAREPSLILPFRWNQAQQQGSRELVRPGMCVVEAEQERNGEEFIWCHHVFMLLNNRFFTNCLQLLFSLFFFFRLHHIRFGNQIGIFTNLSKPWWISFPALEPVPTGKIFTISSSLCEKPGLRAAVACRSCEVPLQPLHPVTLDSKDYLMFRPVGRHFGWVSRGFDVSVVEHQLVAFWVLQRFLCIFGPLHFMSRPQNPLGFRCRHSRIQANRNCLDQAVSNTCSCMIMKSKEKMMW